MTRLHPSLAIFAFTLLTLTGCGPRMGQVHGKIMYKGKPVTAGSVLFVPKAGADELAAGKPAVGGPDENGEFQLSTFAKNDGALVGAHVVTFNAPRHSETVDPVLFAKIKERHEKFGKCRLPPGHTVEVKPGVNEITLELETAP